MAATEPTGAVMRLIDPPQQCGDCAVFALLEDVIRAALLQGGLVHQALPSPTPGGGHRAIIARAGTGQASDNGLERLAKVRGSLYSRLAVIDRAVKATTAIARDGEGMTTAVQVEVRHQCGIIAKQTKKARETLAATGLHR